MNDEVEVELVELEKSFNEEEEEILNNINNINNNNHNNHNNHNGDIPKRTIVHQPSNTSISINSINNNNNSPRVEVPTVLVLRNSAWKGWIPLLFLAFSSITLGFFFLFVRMSFWEVHPIISVVLVVNGLILITMASKESYIFDQKQGKLIISKTYWRGKHSQEHWLLQIKEVSVEEFKDPQGGTDYELYLYLRSGQRLKMFNGHILGVGSKNKLRARDQIKLFLDDFNAKYITGSRASHSEFKGYMKRHLKTLNSSISDLHTLSS